MQTTEWKGVLTNLEMRYRVGRSWAMYLPCWTAPWLLILCAFLLERLSLKLLPLLITTSANILRSGVTVQIGLYS